MAEWLAVITITVFTVISPGPDFAIVSRNALALSRRAGILTALGIGLGVLVHVSYTHRHRCVDQAIASPVQHPETGWRGLSGLAGREDAAQQQARGVDCGQRLGSV